MRCPAIHGGRPIRDGVTCTVVRGLMGASLKTEEKKADEG